MTQETSTAFSKPMAIASTSPYGFLPAIVFLAVMLGGAWQITSAAINPGGLEFPRSWQDFREGRTTGGLEKQLDQKLPMRSTLIATANSIRYVLTRGGGEQVRPGNNDWLFSVEELQYFSDARAHQKARITILRQAASALKANGVTLVVALVPDKARVYPKQVPGGDYPYWHADRYNFLLNELRSQGVATANLSESLKHESDEPPLYYRTDTHWNQAGAQRAAATVADQVRSVVKDLPKTAFVTASTGVSSEKPGDLLRMMGLSNMPNWVRPRPDEETTDVTNKRVSAPSTGLFDTVAVPVVLIGTSYSLRSNFHGYLQQALGAEVLNVARDGGGFIQSAKDYLTDDSFKTSRPQVIVWEIPERMFSPPMTELEKRSLSF